MTELEKYYQRLNQEVYAVQTTSEDGDTQEQAFTGCCIDLLSDSGETENPALAYDERDLHTRKQHKVNGYAISENYETVDLFISLYKPEECVWPVYKEDITQAAKRLTNFFSRAFDGGYENEVAESSDVFVLAHTLGSFNELREKLVRVNAFILTNGEYKGDAPARAEVCGRAMIYNVIDIKSLFQMDQSSRLSIEIDFKEQGFKIPCMSSGTDNGEYTAYIAVMPGECLAKLYEDFGARLLEQNVRSFLQFGGNINKGMRETIRNAPDMFFAYNNGIAATADGIQLDYTGKYITKLNNFQIVNGGQTTASIFYTRKKYKADISKVAVQVKISVVRDKEHYSDIVSSISRFANTQNKVNSADFTANNPVLVRFEKLSRQILTPITADSPLQTYWFFERARGQYQTLKQQAGSGKKARDIFEKTHPNRQKITKTELAKYINSWEEFTRYQKLVIGPHIVALGNEKNYARFISYSMPRDIKEVNNIYFEDTVAKAILFRDADKRYGTKKSGNPIGELKNVVVPYTLSLLNKITEGRLDLYKIWKAQKPSPALSNFIYDLMRQVNAFIIECAEGTHYIEWAKREECWEKVKAHKFEYNIDEIDSDLFDPANPPVRRIIAISDDAVEEARPEEQIIGSVMPETWEKIAVWGRESGFLDIQLQNTAREIARKMKKAKKPTVSELDRASSILGTVREHNSDLLEKQD